MAEPEVPAKMVPKLTAMRAEIIRAIAAHMAFTDGMDRTLMSVRVRICDRVRQVLSEDCTDLEIWTACCSEPRKGLIPNDE